MKPPSTSEFRFNRQSKCADTISPVSGEVDVILSPSLARPALCGSASLFLLILIFVQILGGASIPIVKFRTSEPQGYWTVAGAYWAALLMAVVIFVTWR